METEPAIQQQVFQRKRGFAPRHAVAFFACAALISVLLAFGVFGGFRAVARGCALMMGETLVVDSATKSFGVVAPGDPITVAYRLTNRGEQEVRVVGLRAACRCVVPDDLPFVLRPKESRDLPISIRNLKKEDVPHSQTLDWAITVFTTNPAQVQIALRIKGEIRPNAVPSRSGL